MTEEVRRDRAEEFERRFAEKVDVFSGCVDIRTAKSAAREVFAEMDCAGSELHDGTTGSDVCDQCGVDLAALDSGGDDASRYTSRYTSRNVSACWSECPAVAVGEDGRIGESTASEIAYAREHGKPVRYHYAPEAEPTAPEGWTPTIGEQVSGWFPGGVEGQQVIGPYRGVFVSPSIVTQHLHGRPVVGGFVCLPDSLRPASEQSREAYAEEHGKPVRYHRAAALPPPAQAPWLPTVGEWVTGVGVNSGLPRYGRFARMDQDQPGVAVLHTPLPRLVLADTLRPAEQDGDA